MANHYSALKRVREEKKRTLVNRMRTTRLRHEMRTMRKVLAKKDLTAAQAMVPKAFGMIDRAAKWGIIKKNTAARYKSRMHARLKAMAAPAA
jgi:small subunit ribosomal protein S20